MKIPVHQIQPMGWSLEAHVLEKQQYRDNRTDGLQTVHLDPSMVQRHGMMQQTCRRIRSGAGWKISCSLEHHGGKATSKCISHKNLEDPGTCHRALLFIYLYKRKKQLPIYHNDQTVPSSLDFSGNLLIHIKNRFCL